jgi:hypothetical protein
MKRNLKLGARYAGLIILSCYAVIGVVSIVSVLSA